MTQTPVPIPGFYWAKHRAPGQKLQPVQVLQFDNPAGIRVIMLGDSGFYPTTSFHFLGEIPCPQNTPPDLRAQPASPSPSTSAPTEERSK